MNLNLKLERNVEQKIDKETAFLHCITYNS